jgi:protein-S-isoprenylcysteine O-methyltransferase Ste14
MPKRETDNTRLGHCIVCLFLLDIVLSVFSSWSLYCPSFPLGHCIVCLFLLVIVLSVFSKTNNTMAKRKRHTIQCPRGKDRQCNDQEEKTDNKMVFLFLFVIVLSVFYFWSLYCLSFPLGHCIVCLFLMVIVLFVFYFWSLYCLFFTQYNVQEEKTHNTMTKRKRQTIQCPRGKDRQCKDQEEKNCIVCLFRFVIVLSVSLLGIVLYVFCSWAFYCLSFPLGHQEEKTDNTMSKRKRHTIQ